MVHSHAYRQSLFFLGKHYIDVFWSGFPLPQSPFQGYAVPYRDEPDAYFEPLLVRTTSPLELRYKIRCIYLFELPPLIVIC